MDILALTPLGLASKRRREQLESEDFPLRFRLALARKDAELIREAAHAAHADARVLGAAATWFADAEEAGLGDRDYSEILRLITRETSAPGPD